MVRLVKHTSLDNINFVRNKLQNCGMKISDFSCEGCGTEKGFPLFCGYRCCNKCRKYREIRVRKRMKPILLKFRNPKLLTLTIKGHHKLDQEIKNKIYKHAREFFRRTKLDGIRVLEIKRYSDGYYYHLHCIIDTHKYILQSLLSKVWHNVTKDSYIVDIRRITSMVGLWYVLKYSAKPLERMTVNEYVDFFHGTRMHTKFGRFYGMKITPDGIGYIPCPNCFGVLKFYRTRDYGEKPAILYREYTQSCIENFIKDYR